MEQPKQKILSTSDCLPPIPFVARKNFGKKDLNKNHMNGPKRKKWIKLLCTALDDCL